MLILGGHIIYTHMPPVYNETVTASLEMPSGTPVETTEAEIGRIHSAALTLKDVLAREYPRDPPIRKVMMVMGGRGGGYGGMGSTGATHLGEVTIELSAAEGRDLDAGKITDRWRENVGEIIGAQELSFFNRFGRWGSDIEIEISGN